MKLTRRIPPQLIFSMVILCTYWYIGSRDFFFWDTVQLASKQAHFFFENSFSSIILPQEIDSGHFPLFGMYIASWWVCFGKTLWVSHLAMLPWILLLALAIFRLSAILLPEPYRIWTILLLCFEPTLVAQVTLVSPDIILITTFLWSIVLYIRHQNVMLSIALTVLCLISLRGFILGCSMLLSHMFFPKNSIHQTLTYNRLVAFFPGIFLSLGFFVYHYHITSWVGFHADSPWSESFSGINILGWLKNTALFIWRILDFGRIFIVLGILWLLFIKKEKFNAQIKNILYFFVISGSVLYLVTVGFESLTAHRYYLPLYMMMILLFASLLFASSLLHKHKIWITTLMTIGLMTGNFWIYPDKMAQGWDASLAHRPIFSLSNDLEIYLKENKIPKNEVATFFPFLSEEKFLYLNNNSDKYYPWESKTSGYLLLSNIFNDAPDSLFTNYPKEKAVFYEKKRGVWLGLYHNNSRE